MLTMSVIDYFCELKQAGFTDQQSEVLARQLERIVSYFNQELKMQRKDSGCACCK